jgi:hypothetical protein
MGGSLAGGACTVVAVFILARIMYDAETRPLLRGTIPRIAVTTTRNRETHSESIPKRGLSRVVGHMDDPFLNAFSKLSKVT